MKHNETPFKFLGFQAHKGTTGRFRLYFSVSGAVVMIQDRALFKNGEHAQWALAPQEYWEYHYGNRGGVRWDVVNSWIIHSSFKAGIYAVKHKGPVVHKNLTARSKIARLRG